DEVGCEDRTHSVEAGHAVDGGAELVRSRRAAGRSATVRPLSVLSAISALVPSSHWLNSRGHPRDQPGIIINFMKLVRSRLKQLLSVGQDLDKTAPHTIQPWKT